VTTTESAAPSSTGTPSTAARSSPLPGIELDDPVRVAEALRDEFRAGAAERDRFYTPTDAEGVTIHDDWSGFG